MSCSGGKKRIAAVEIALAHASRLPCASPALSSDSVTGNEEWHCKTDVAEDSGEPPAAENQCYTVEDSTEVVCTTDLQETAWFMGMKEDSFSKTDEGGSAADECDLTWRYRTLKHTGSSPRDGRGGF